MLHLEENKNIKRSLGGLADKLGKIYHHIVYMYTYESIYYL